MAGISAIGWCVPERRSSARDLAKMFHVPLKSIEAFGLQSRAEPDKADHPSTLGARAVRYALEAAGIPVDQFGLLIFAGMTRDYPSPWVAAFGVLHLLGVTRAAGLDISNRCAGAHDALWLAAKLVDAGVHERVVVCCADRFDSIYNVDREDRSPSDLAYAAGAAAAVIDRSAKNEIVAYASYTNPDLSAHAQNVPLVGGTKHAFDEDSFSTGMHLERNLINLGQTKQLLTYLREADAHNIRTVARAAQFEAIDFVIASPLDIRAQWASLAEIGIPRSKTFFMLPRLGHLGPADSFINLGVAAGAMRIGSRIVMSTRTVAFSNAIAIRSARSTLRMRVKGTGITREDIEYCSGSDTRISARSSKA